MEDSLKNNLTAKFDDFVNKYTSNLAKSFSGEMNKKIYLQPQVMGL